jgi:hypothetical protein
LNANRTTDCLLLQAMTTASETSAGVTQLRNYCAQSHLGMQLGTVAFNPEKNLLYTYLQLPQRQQMDSAALALIADDVRQRAPALAELALSRMQLMLDAPGHSSGESAHFHYIVETDPQEGWMAEISHWYDTEHMIGLARVPGCIQARRMLNHDQGPVSLACYDLVSEQTLGSGPWLAVRGTEWSSRVRPHFTNTKRTMFNWVREPVPN